MMELLAALSAAAAAGIRTALPLLVIGLLQGEDLWSGIPIGGYIHSSVVLGVLSSWSLVELFASKNLLGQRLLQLIQLVFSPIVGAIMALALGVSSPDGTLISPIAQAEMTVAPSWLVGLVGGLFALLLQLVQAGWFYRWGSFPLWIVFIQDGLSVLLVFLAVDAPQLGGIVALILLFLAIFSFRRLRRWYASRND